MSRHPKLTDELVRKFGVRVCWHPDELHQLAGRDPIREDYQGVRSARAVAQYAATKHASTAWAEVNYGTGPGGRPLWTRADF